MYGRPLSDHDKWNVSKAVHQYGYNYVDEKQFRRVQITYMMWEKFQWTLLFYKETRNNNELFVQS